MDSLPMFQYLPTCFPPRDHCQLPLTRADLLPGQPLPPDQLLAGGRVPPDEPARLVRSGEGERAFSNDVRGGQIPKEKKSRMGHGEGV